MREKLSAVHHNVAELMQEVEEAMNARTAMITATQADLTHKARTAKKKQNLARNAYLKGKRLFDKKMWPSLQEKTRFYLLTEHYRQTQAIAIKLEKAKTLITSLQRDDELRQSEFLVQNGKITPLWDGLNDKVIHSHALDTADHDNYKKIEQYEEKIIEIHAAILRNSERIAQCRQMALAYDEAHPERFPAYWLSMATVIVEQDDFYGFHGEIDYQDLNATKTPGTGLEGYCTTHGAILKEGQIVRYTLPNTKVQVIQDHTGRVIDKTDPSADIRQKALAAIKSANLLLLDRTHHPAQKIHLEGPAEYIQQARLVVAALLVAAQKAGIVLNLEDIEVDVPGWTNWRSSNIESLREIEQYKKGLDHMVYDHHAQNELKDKITDLKRESHILSGEPLLPPRKP